VAVHHAKTGLTSKRSEQAGRDENRVPNSSPRYSRVRRSRDDLSFHRIEHDAALAHCRITEIGSVAGADDQRSNHEDRCAGPVRCSVGLSRGRARRCHAMTSANAPAVMTTTIHFGTRTYLPLRCHSDEATKWTPYVDHSVYGPKSAFSDRGLRAIARTMPPSFVATPP
jgi:hypothetical protein